MIGSSAAFRRKRPAKAGTPTSQIEIDKRLATSSRVDAMMTSQSDFDKRNEMSQPAIAIAGKRLLGTMVTYGYPDIDLDDELRLAQRIGASVLEILPMWNQLPDPALVHARAAESGFVIHSAHGCWGGQSIRAARVDLGSTDPAVQRDSIDDLKRCIDWLKDARGKHLVVHPGGLSMEEQKSRRRDALARGLLALADHTDGTGVVVCVENMPPGVYPGSQMVDLAGLVAELERPQLALALDTGHANLTSGVAGETLAAGTLLLTTHVHDNDGRQDTHLPPGAGTVNWLKWRQALDEIGYCGPIMLECIRHLRKSFADYRPGILADLVAPAPSSPHPPQRL
jgi:sugar phosphate isomerase/epimerase